MDKKIDKRVWSRYDDVKIQVSNYHTEFTHAYTLLKAMTYSKRSESKCEEPKLRALQNLVPLLHFGKLSGGIQSSTEEIENLISEWDKVDIDVLKYIHFFLEKEFEASHFYDVTIDQENRQIIDIEATMRACGL